MHKCIRSLVVFLGSLSSVLSLPSSAQQTLGAINGTVSDSTGAVLSKVEVKIRNLDTNLEVVASTKDDGSYLVNALPIGPYSVSFARDGFKTEVHNQITVVGGVTATINGSLQPGEVSTSITVSGTPLLNQTDTTNGYTLGTELIESTPLGTGSFTQLALLSPGVNADFLTGSGTNAGMGNQNIFANGQRDTSNSFVVNGVQTNNLFNGKSSSGVADNRAVLNTGQNTNGSPGGEIQTSTSVYSAIGQAMPAPPAGNARRSSRQHIDVRRLRRLLQRRAHHAANAHRHEPISRPGLRISPDRRLERRSLLLQSGQYAAQPRQNRSRTQAQQLRRDLRRPDQERQALLLRLLSRPARFRRRQLHLRSQRSPRPERYQPRRRRASPLSPTPPSAPRSPLPTSARPR